MSTEHRYTGYIKSFGNVGFIAGINELKGMVEQANSPEGAIEKLILGLRIRTAYVEKTDLSKIHFKVEPRNKNAHSNSSIPEKEVDLILQ
jgi:hypothetical protein